LVLGASAEDARPSAGLLVDVQRLGWGVLAERPDREVVLGAVTRPWEPNVTFRAIAPEDFASFDEPDYVKITWTLRADPRRRGVDLSDGDAGGGNRRRGATEVPPLLGRLLARDLPDSL